MKILLAVAGCALLCLVLALSYARAQSNVPAALSISSVTPGDGSLTVAWTAPTSGSTATAYDLRYIKTSDDETDDANWTLEEDVWTSGAGSLEYTITGLENGVGYDVQVRAVASGSNGGWSPTSTGTPADHGGNRSTATEMGLNTSVIGYIDPASDNDYFKIVLPEASGIFAYTTSYISGFLPTTGELQNSFGSVIKTDDDDDQFRQYGPQLFLWDTLEAGTYYIRVSAPETGAYTLHTETIKDTTGTGDAADLALNGFATGILDPGADDEDYFKIEVSQETDLMIRVARAKWTIDTEGTLLDRDGAEIAVHDDSFLIGNLREQFLIRKKLEAGVYYLRVRDAPGRSYRTCWGATPEFYLGTWTDCPAEESQKSKVGNPGPYAVSAEVVTPPGSSRSRARHLTLGEDALAGGRIDTAGNADYFSITVTETTYVRVQVVSASVETDGLLLDSGGREKKVKLSERDYVPGGLGFVLYGTLDAGTSYIKVTAGDNTETGPYTIVAQEDTVYSGLIDECSAIATDYGDPLYGCQWSLNNTGQGGGTAGEDINVEEVWDGGNLGAGVNVAIISNGLYYNHEDLEDNVNAARNHDYTPRGDVFERYYTRGTKAAGIIAARDNDLGVRGVAPRATIYAYNFVRNPTLGNMVDAMTRDFDDTGVSNHGWGLGRTPSLQRVSRVWELAVDAGVSKGMGGKGIFYTFPGGGDTRGLYSGLSEVFNYYAVTAVCAVNDEGQKTYSSGQGPNLWVCAPSSDSNQSRGGMPGTTTTDNYNRYARNFGGTSEAAALVSGVVALVRSAYPDLTWRDVKLILAGSTRKNDASNSGWETGALKYGSTGDYYNFNHEYGFGVVDAKAAVDLAENWTNLPPMRKVTGGTAGNIDLSIPDGGSMVSNSVIVGSGVSFIEFVEVNATFDHPSFRDLKVELVSPSGAVSILSVPYDSEDKYPVYSSFRFGSAKHLGESAAGTWTLRITDSMTGNAGTLKSWSITVYGQGEGIGAPAITSVVPGSASLTVAWTAPADTGGSPITAYDLRHILSTADETVDANWTVVDDIWTAGSGALAYTLSGLVNGVGYDVQVRAVTTGDGPWSATVTGTPGMSATAPTITLVRADDSALVVSWVAPTGVTATTTAYDVRHIPSDASNKADANWTVEEDAWTGGKLEHGITGLTNGVGYDVQVRAVTTGDGPWSATVSGTPADHGDTLDTATLLASSDVFGAIDPAGEADYFKLEVHPLHAIVNVGFWIFTLGDLDTVGDLLDSSGLPIDSNDDGRVLPNPENFFLWRTAEAETYYIKVSGFESAQGSYVLRVGTFVDTYCTSTVSALKLGGSAGGMLDPGGDTDCFSLNLSEPTDVILRSSGFPDTTVELLNSGGGQIEFNDDGYLPTGWRQFLIRRSLESGTYYLKVGGFDDDEVGPYSVHATEAMEPGSTIADAQPLTLGVAAGGTIDTADDVNYFSLTITEPTYVAISAVSDDITANGALLDSNGDPVQADIVQGSYIDIGFTIRDRLDAGTYYVKVTGDGGADTGGYVILAIEEAGYSLFIEDCSDIDTSAGINDALYGCQWHLNNTGQFRRGARQDINVEEVWDAGTLGAGINVAVVDYGMHYEHEDLSENVNTSFNYNYIDQTTDIYDSYDDHGTAVAGLIAARDNNLGMRGVAPRATIYGYNVLLDLNDMTAADAMSRNATSTAISNNSWGKPDSPGPKSVGSFWEAAVRDGVTDGYGGKGIFYVWAGGNGDRRGDYSNLDEYNSYYAVTSVCAVNHADVRTAYSEEGSNLWVCAPSGDRTRNMPGIATTDNGSRYMGDFGGTSAATPIVSGVAALVREANGALTWRDVKLILAASARKNDAANPGWEQGAPKYGSTTERYNFNHEYGFGMVDAKAAVDLAKSWNNLPALREISAESGDIDLTIPDATSSKIGSTVTSSVTIGPYVEFIEFIQVDAHFDHPSFRDLDVELVSPSGAVSKLVPPNGARRVPLTAPFRFGSAKHLGEDAAGVWTLRVTDHYNSYQGTLKSWSLTAYGHGFFPGPPEITLWGVGAGHIIIEWKAPTNTGDSAVTSYDVRYIRTDAPDLSDAYWTVRENIWTSGDLEYTFTGLEGGVPYYVQVRAVNDEGPGPWAGDVIVDFSTVVPPAPAITSVTAGDRALAVVWTSPAGPVITAFDVRYIRSDATDKADANWTVLDNAWTSGALQYTITGLTNGVEYDVQVRAENSAGPGPWSATETGTPKQDDVPVTLQWEQTAIVVDEGAGTLTLRAVAVTTVNTAPVAGSSFDVTVTTTGGSASQFADYTGLSTTATFSAADFSQADVNGQQRYRATKEFTVAILDDTIDEPDESFTATLAYVNPGLPHLRGGSATVTTTITDNDHVPVTLGWRDATVSVDEGAGTVTLRAIAVTTKDKMPDTGFSFQATVSTAEGSAEQTTDYTHLAQTVTFQQSEFSRATVNGQSRYRAERQIVVSILDDTEDEPEEDFKVTLAYSNPSLPHLQGGPATATVNIGDNDHVPVTIAWEDMAVAVNEDAGTVTLRAIALTTKDKAPEAGFSFGVTLATTPNTATQGDDYRVASTSGTFRQGDFSRETVNGEARYRAVKEFNLVIIDDTADEPSEDFTLTLAYSDPGLPYLQGGSETVAVAITDNDHVPVVLGWDGAEVTVSETDGSVSLRAVVRTTKDKRPETSFTFDVTVTTANGSATQPADYTRLSTTETFSRSDFTQVFINGQWHYEAGKTFTVAVANDGIAEPSETFTVTLAYADPGPPHLQGGAATAMVTITDDLSSTVDLYLTGYNSLTPVSRGDQLTHEYTVRNRGPADATNTIVTTTLDPGVSFVSATTTTAITPCTHSGKAMGGTVRCDFGTLDTRTSHTGTIVVEVAQSASSDITVASAASSDELDSSPEDNTATYFTDLYEPPQRVTNLSAVSRGDNQIELSWTKPADNGDPITFYDLERKEGTGDYASVIPAPGVAATTYLDDGLVAGTTYTYRLRARNDDSEAEWSNEAVATTGKKTPPPPPPRPTPSDNGGGGGGGGGGPVNDEPEFTEGPSTTRSVAENVAEGTAIGAPVAATDDDEDPLSYSIIGADASSFAVDGESGQLRVRAALDHEARDSYRLRVDVSDGKDGADSIRVDITVTNVDEAPVLTGDSAIEYAEEGTGAVAAYASVDPEGSDIAWALTGDDAVVFSFGSEALTGDDAALYQIIGGGALAFRTPPDFEAPTDANRDNVYKVTVEASDGANTGTLDVTVTVTNVDEGLALTGDAAIDYAEGGTGDAATYAAVDLEGADIAWTLTGDDAGAFSIEGGALSFRSPPDFEAPADANGDNIYRVRVEASDGTNPVSLDVTITLTDVDLGSPYDADANETIDKDEAITAAVDYFADRISKEEAIWVIVLYFLG